MTDTQAAPTTGDAEAYSDEFNITGEAGNYKVELIANVGLDGTFACDTFHEVVVEPYDHRQVRMTYLDVAQES